MTVVTTKTDQTVTLVFAVARSKIEINDGDDDGDDDVDNEYSNRRRARSFEAANGRCQWITIIQ